MTVFVTISRQNYSTDVYDFLHTRFHRYGKIHYSVFFTLLSTILLLSKRKIIFLVHLNEVAGIANTEENQVMYPTFVPRLKKFCIC